MEPSKRYSLMSLFFILEGFAPNSVLSHGQISLGTKTDTFFFFLVQNVKVIGSTPV